MATESSVKLKIVQLDHIVIRVKDVEGALQFYTEVLGFKVHARMDDVGKSGWASLSQGPVQLMLASPHDGPEPVKVDGRYPQAIYYLYPEDVVGLHELVSKNGYPVGDLRVTFYGMKEFELVDPSGHYLLFGQDTDEETTIVED